MATASSAVSGRILTEGSVIASIASRLPEVPDRHRRSRIGVAD
jgi:hypothetical protein